MLARILKHGGNFLIMDEPTNDLDLPTLRLLEEALLAFSGCVLVVSHDRYFLNRVCTGIIAFEGEWAGRLQRGRLRVLPRKTCRAKRRAWPSEPVTIQSRLGPIQAQASKAKPRKIDLEREERTRGHGGGNPYQG